MEDVLLAAVQLRHEALVAAVSEVLQANHAFYHFFILSGIILPTILAYKFIEARPHRESLLGSPKEVKHMVVLVHVEPEHLEAEEEAVDEAHEGEAGAEDEDRDEAHPDHAADQRGQLFVLPLRHVPLEQVPLQIV